MTQKGLDFRVSKVARQKATTLIHKLKGWGSVGAIFHDIYCRSIKAWYIIVT